MYGYGLVLVASADFPSIKRQQITGILQGHNAFRRILKRNRPKLRHEWRLVLVF
jgi:hypothetical protein